MKYEDWEKTVPEAMKGDSVWNMAAYRLSLLLSDLGWNDVTKLTKDRRTRALADQLYRALGSTRESRDWYYKGRHVLGETIVNHRIQLLSQVIRLLLTMVPQQRGNLLREQRADYQTDLNQTQPTVSADGKTLEVLMQNIHLPDS